MKSSALKVSLVALALFSAVGVADAGKKAEALMPATQPADTPQEENAIRQFLAAGKDLSKMKLPRLQQRLHKAETFRGTPNLPADLDQALADEIARITKEITSRQQGAGDQQAPTEQAQQPAEPQLEQPPLPPYDPQKAQAEQQAQDQQSQDQQQPAHKRRKQAQQAQAQQDQAQPETQAQPAPQPQPEASTGSPEATAFLQSVRPATELSGAELRQQMQRAMELSQAQDLSPAQRDALRNVIREARAGMKNKQEQAQQPAAETPPAVAQQPAPQPQPQTQAQPTPQPQPGTSAGSPEATAFLQSVRPATELSGPELRQQMQRAMELSQAQDLSAEQRDALRKVIREARAGMKNTQDQAQQPGAEAQPPVAQQPAQQPPAQQQTQQAQQPPAPPAPTEQQLANPTVNPALERQAQAYLNDNEDVRTMKRKQLRKRLTGVRDLLATNQLAPQTREAVRQKLAQERAVLRNEVAVDEGLPPPVQQPQPGQQQAQLPQGTQPQPQPGQQQPPPQQGGNGGSTTSNSNVTINNNTTINNTQTDVRVVLQDRRPPQQLDDRELVRRIDVYREVVADDRYDQEQRMMWRQQMEEDRRYLRRQMMEERQQREARLREGDYQLNVHVQDRYEPGYDVPDDVFAAEADDSEIADVLAAPPRRQIQHRYTLNDIEQQPQVREAVARIEIDTVHFGFGEGFLREEEIDKLDRIATVLEKILAKHPDEVFLIEGHTDAVGSDASNLVLSRQRAEAVKQALTTYYVIPAQNLKTVGLGERYLKIPTNQPEAENRRVSLARITALVGQAAD